MSASDPRTTAIAVAQFAPAADEAANLAVDRRARRDGVRPRRRAGGLPRVLQLLRRPLRRDRSPRTPRRSTARSSTALTAAGRRPTAWWSWRVCSSVPRRSAACATPSSPSMPAASSRATASCTSTTRSGSASRTGSSRASSAPPETFEIDGLRFGLMTCYDLRFPEVGRTLADAGADVVPRPRRVGARAAQGAPLAHAHRRSRDREHRLRRCGRSPAAARGGQLHDRGSAGRGDRRDRNGHGRRRRAPRPRRGRACAPGESRPRSCGAFGWFPATEPEAVCQSARAASRDAASSSTSTRLHAAKRTSVAYSRAVRRARRRP